MIKFKIVEVNDADHSIVARFYSDKVTEADLSVDEVDGVIRRARTDISIGLPVPTPVGADLDAYILKYAPSEWLATIEAVRDPGVQTDMAEATARLGVEKTATDQEVADAKTPPVDPNAEVWEQQAYDSKLAKALVRLGVLKTDPTAIPVTKA